MGKKEDAEKVLNIVKDYKSQSNKDLVFAMDFMKEDFEQTKETLIKLTHHLIIAMKLLMIMVMRFLNYLQKIKLLNSYMMTLMVKLKIANSIKQEPTLSKFKK